MTTSRLVDDEGTSNCQLWVFVPLYRLTLSFFDATAVLLILMQHYRWLSHCGQRCRTRIGAGPGTQNVRLRRLVANLSLEKQVLKDVASGNL